MLLLSVVGIFILVTIWWWVYASVGGVAGFNVTNFFGSATGILIARFLRFFVSFFWICPYMMVSLAKFYDDIKSVNDEIFIAPKVNTPTEAISQSSEDTSASVTASVVV
ncbi:MAG: hypothetical protein KBC41_01815 [Candidatus Pacebacteria bacterium]|nr:hypothetical protein [Candidatus Paceibacterota bacterium]MBP9866795.1 hypothetical protein [Candidatus Paceibacterota bacterium]